jgi:hypothetical protein
MALGIGRAVLTTRGPDDVVVTPTLDDLAHPAVCLEDIGDLRSTP